MKKKRSRRQKENDYNLGLKLSPCLFIDDVFYTASVSKYTGFLEGIYRQLGGVAYHRARFYDNSTIKYNPFITNSREWDCWEEGWDNAFGYDEFDNEHEAEVWAETCVDLNLHYDAR